MSKASVPVVPPEPPGLDSLFAPAARRAGGGGGGGGPKPPPEDGAAKGGGTSRAGKAGKSGASKDAKEESERYRQAHRLECADRISDGFCDLAVDGGVIVDRSIDETLDLVITKAQQKLQKASDPVTALMALGLFVSEVCGRSGKHAADLADRSAKRVEERRGSDGRVLIGGLFGDQGKKKKHVGAGVSRHRALVFKVLSDLLGLAECTLEREPSYMTAWNTVQLNQVGYVVDLLHDPGALYESGSPKQQEYVRLLSTGFSGLDSTLSTQTSLQGRVPRPSWHVEATELQYGRDSRDLLGKGGFGQVYKGTWEDAAVAVKVVKDKDPTDYDVLDFVLEIALLSRLSHPNVMRFWRGCAVLEGGKRVLLMVTEHIEKGGLSGLIHGHGGPKLQQELTIGQVLVLGLGIARGMQYLHSCNVLHLDLKSPNVLVDSGWTPKLCDFGLAKISMQQAGDGFQTTLRGVSPIWAPPEMFDDRADSMTDKADVYSFGIVFFELACRQLPFQEVSQRQLPKAKYEGVLPQVPSQVPQDFSAFIKALCSYKPGSRPSMSGAVARITEFAKVRSLDLTDVVMPAWEQDAGASAKEQELLSQLEEKRARLQEERQQLLAQVERTREQRRRMQEAHLGSGIAEEAAMPAISSSPRSPGSGSKGGKAGGAAGGRAVSAGLGALGAPSDSKKACCATQ